MYAHTQFLYYKCVNCQAVCGGQSNELLEIINIDIKTHPWK